MIIEIPDNATNKEIVETLFGLHSNAMALACRNQTWWNSQYKVRDKDESEDEK